MSFCISESRNSNSYRPFVARGEKGYLVVWSRGVEEEDTAELVAVHYQDKVAQKEHTIARLDNWDEPHYLTPISNNRFVMAIEEQSGTRIIVLDGVGEPIGNHYLPQKGLLLNLFTLENIVYFFMLDRTAVNVYRTETGAENWSNAELMLTHHQIYSIPHVMQFETGYLVSWLNENEEVAYIFNTIYNLDNKISANAQILCPFELDYLLTTSVGGGMVGFSGYSAHDRMYRSMFVRWDCSKNELVKVSDRYWKAVDYKDRAFYVAPLKNGFLLMTDGPQESQVAIQRFTRANTFLTYLTPVDTDMEATSSPEFAQCGEEGDGLLVYVKSFSDRSEIFGKWISIGPIPELD